MDDLDLGATIKGFSPGQKVFGRYTLARVLGRGGMGVVWLARDEELGREVAMKFLPEVVAGDRAAIEEMKREVRRAIDLAHPHIVKTNDFVTDGRLAAVSMEYAPGGTVGGARLDQPGQVFSVALLEPWVRQLASALDYAHGHAEVVHRDLKPNNLMLDAKGRLKVVDFGIAASISDSVSRVSKQAGTSGTPVYMSPQQMMGETPAPTDDLYAVGATLFELLTSKPPFHAGNILLQVQNKPAPPVNERRRALGLDPVPEAWEAGIAACLAKDPAARPQSGSELLTALGLTAAPARAVAPTPVPAPSPAVVATVPPPAPAAPKVVPSSAAWATKAAGLVGLAVVCFGLIFFLDEASGDDVGRVVAASVTGGVIIAALAWLPLFILHRISAPATPDDLALRAARQQAKLEKRRKSNREMRAALLATLPPYLLFAGWLIERGLRRDESEVGLFATVVVGWGILALFYLAFMRLLASFGMQRLWTTVLVSACTGAAFTAFLWWHGLALPTEMVVRNDLPAVLAAATLWAVAGGIFHRLTQGPTDVDRRVVQLGGVFGAVLLLHALYFSVLELPEQARAVERVVEERRLAEEQRVREEEAKQAAEKARVAAERVQAAYVHVFGTKPTAESERQWVGRVLESTAWNDADLRREMRSSPEGARGGRLLVPEEFLRITDAIVAASPGNVVVIGPGTYSEDLYVGKDVDLIGPGDGRAVVMTSHNGAALHINGATGVLVRGLTFMHSSTDESERRYAVVTVRDAAVVFEGNEFTRGNGPGISVFGGGRVVLRGNRVHGNRWSGISTSQDAEVEIIDNDIRDNGGDGLSVHEAARRVLVGGNRFTGNGGIGITMRPGAGVTVERNAFTRSAPNTFAVWWDTAQAAPRFGAGNTVDGQPLRTDAPN